MIRRYLLVPACFISLWWIVSLIGFANPLFLPSPVAVMKKFWELIFQNKINNDILATMTRTIIGFSLSAILGVFLGLLLGINRKVYDHFEVGIDFLRSIPATALFPLFILFFGVGDLAKITVVMFSCSLIILINTAYGVINSQETRRLMSKIFGASRTQQFVKVIFPEALPQIFVGFRTAVSIALILVVVTEMFMGTTKGLGFRIYNAQLMYRTTEMYSAIILTGLIGYGLNQCFVFFEHKIIHWGGK